MNEAAFSANTPPGPAAAMIILAIGFVFSGWYYAWIVFLIPGLLRTYLANSD